MPRTLFIDADACPVTRESIDCARRAGVAVVIAGNSTQNLERHIRRDDKATIDMQLFIRHEEKKVRRAGGRTRGPAAFTSEDRARFKRNLTELLR